MNEKEVISYLKTTVRDMIIDDVISVAEFHCNQNVGRNEGFFDIPRQVFCIVDFLGYLLNPPRKNKGHDTSYRAIKFITAFFPETYKNIAPLIYQQWRHDTVHTLLPKKYITRHNNEEIKLYWLSSRSRSKVSLDVHMLPMYQKGKRNCITIIVNMVQLAADLLNAFDKFLKKIETDDKVKADSIKRFNELFEYQEPIDDYKEIIVNVWKNPCGILDGKNVIERFNTC
ncbi:MAG: hypothetical protein ACOY90_08410 [Candidatus Zhuqueibacterota bacterium]